MRVRLFALVVMAFLGCMNGVAQERVARILDTVSMEAVTQRYSLMLDSLAVQVRMRPADTAVRYTPLYFRMFAPPTLYDAPLEQAFGVFWSPSLPGRMVSLPSLGDYAGEGRAVVEGADWMLMRTYADTPWLIEATEDELEQAGGIEEEVLPEMPAVAQLVTNEMAVDLTDDVDEVQLVVRRPNFWKVKGDYSFQLTQNHFSDNWYQGGDNNYTMLALLTMEANFNNKQKIQWDNKLEMRLGFQTSKTDEKHKFKTNDDLLRFTTKIGYKATAHWFYTLQVQAYTQFYPSFNANSDVVSSDFMSPFNLVVSLGMDYKLELKRFKGSANLAPVAYNFRSVERRSLFGNFGLDEGKCMYHNFGPNITVNYSWEIWKNIKWDARIYWFSNMESTDIEWENTFTFTINRFLNSKLFLYPRIDDSSENYRRESNGSYFMFKEWFSLGLNYSF